MFFKPIRAAAVAAVLAIAAAACSSSDGESGRACSVIGCGAAFQLDALIDGTPEAVPQMTIEMCRNADCLRGSFAQSTVPHGDFVASVTFPDPLVVDTTATGHVDAAIQDTASAGPGLQLRLQVYPGLPALADGDTYKVTVKQGSAVVTSIERSVVYTVSYPNGVECGPECKNASL